MVAGFSVGQPDGDDEAAALQLETVARSGGDDFPIILGAKRLERRGDVDGGAPRDAVVGAAHGEGARVVHAVDELNRARGAVDDGDGVVDGLLALAAGRLARIALETRADVCDLFSRPPRFPAVGRAAEVNLNLAPVGAIVAARLAVGEHGALGRDDDTGNAVALDTGHLGGEHVGGLEQRRGAERGACGEEEKERTNEVHGGKMRYGVG